MKPRIFWIPVPRGRLGLMGRPRGGDWLEEELQQLAAQGATVILSALTGDERAELGLSEMADHCSRIGITLLSLPIPDRGVPDDRAAVAAVVFQVRQRLLQGDAAIILCRAGIGRSALLTACVLRTLDYDTQTAWAMIGAARGVSVPDTEEQRKWVEAWKFIPA